MATPFDGATLQRVHQDDAIHDDGVFYDELISYPTHFRAPHSVPPAYEVITHFPKTIIQIRHQFSPLPRIPSTPTGSTIPQKKNRNPIPLEWKNKQNKPQQFKQEKWWCQNPQPMKLWIIESIAIFFLSKQKQTKSLKYDIERRKLMSSSGIWNSGK